MALGPYNGWSGKIRQTRGSLFYAQVGKTIPKPKACELCGSDVGLTYHAEQYGSTWDDYINCTHALCSYCHGMIHVRTRLPNRFFRWKQRLKDSEPMPFIFSHIGLFFRAARMIGDIAAHPNVETGTVWVDKLSTVEWVGPQKIALIVTADGEQKPDPKVYASDEKPSGLRYDSKTHTLLPYP